ncbi:type II toxin-antitoxin system prevent-host-death family antitoxin [Cellulomonas sp. IC4_254]|uniref:type II toxin-antitoxin system Phd/YefM family antitoxin n=1 Tax=Cellulomonas sp. IC4_254 TaxID=2714040 RepID=UPI001F0E9617|nr:type II toxin-antitoxin system prevent-host-death family antitoxin [Cellulomonas sp. IC4_254]
MKAVTRAVDARRAAGPGAAGGAGGDGAPEGEPVDAVAAPVPGGVALDDAAGRLPELVQAVEHGDEVTLTRDGRPVARIVAVAGAARRTSGRGSAAGATVAANVSTTAIQLTPPGDPGAAGTPGVAGNGAPGVADALDAPGAPGALDAPLGAPTAAPLGAPAAETLAEVPSPELPEPTAPTRVSTRTAEPEPPATTDATVVLDPVPATDEPPAPPRRRSRRDQADPTEQLGTVDPGV